MGRTEIGFIQKYFSRESNTLQHYYRRAAAIEAIKVFTTGQRQCRKVIVNLRLGHFLK